MPRSSPPYQGLGQEGSEHLGAVWVAEWGLAWLWGKGGKVPRRACWNGRWEGPWARFVSEGLMWLCLALLGFACRYVAFVWLRLASFGLVCPPLAVVWLRLTLFGVACISGVCFRLLFESSTNVYASHAIGSRRSQRRRRQGSHRRSRPISVRTHGICYYNPDKTVYHHTHV
jgi:hypothetical protein